MNSLAILIPIIAVSCGLFAVIGGVFVKPWLKLRERKMELEAQMVAEKAAQYAAHSERLEQRVRVLERIITGSGFDIANQIDALDDDDARRVPQHRVS